MTNSQILKKAIEKAVKNGYKLPNGEIDIKELISSHDFAKALWGINYFEKGGWFITDKETSKILRKQKNKEKLPAWQYHLQQLVLEPEPLKYIEKYL